MRLNRFLQQAGVASRRKADRLIQTGHVRVNGEVVREPWREVDPRQDRVTVNGKLLPPPSEARRYFKLYKPRGVVSTLSDPHAKRTLRDLLPPEAQGTHPVGRLDRDSEGLLLLTDDGELTQILTHPRHRIPKTYLVAYTGDRPASAVARWLLRGLTLEDGPFRPLRVEPVGDREVRIVLTEGRKREIRRAFRALGLKVVRLLRIQMGPVFLDPEQAPGEIRPLTPAEVRALLKLKEAQRSSG